MRNQYFRAFVRDNVLVLIGQVLVFAKPLLLTPLLIKKVSVEVLGGYVLLLSIVGFVVGTASLGVGFLFKRYAPAESDPIKRGNLFYPQFMFQLISVGLCALVVLLFGDILQNLFFGSLPSFSPALLAVYCLASVFYSQVATYFRYTGRMRWFVGATVIYPYGSIAAILSMYVSGVTLHVDRLLVADIVSMLLVAGVGFVGIWREIGLIPKFPKIDNLKKDISLGFPGILSYWTDFFLTAIPRYLIAFFISLTAVGSYTAALQIGLLVSVAIRMLGVAFPPILARAVDSGHSKDAGIMVNYAVKGLFTLSIPFVAMSMFFSGPMLEFYANKEVSSIAHNIIPLAAISVVFYGLSSILSQVLTVNLRTKDILAANLKASFIAAISTGIGLYFWPSLLVPGMGIVVGYVLVFAGLKARLPPEWELSMDYPYLLKSGVIAGISCGTGRILLGVLFYIGGDIGISLSIALSFSCILHFLVMVRAQVITTRESVFATECFKSGIAKLAYY